MSLLAPLYFAGALAIGLPILFHLIRRRPKSEVQFSSLMFLEPTPPRLTRRSRLDNWPLLLARAIALMLLAAAFARPFLRTASDSDPRLPPRRIVILVDTSSSMKRSDLWQQAVRQAREVIDALEPDDRLALVSFDREPKAWLELDESSRLPIDERRRTAIALLDDIQPTWFGTDTARALVYAADVTMADGEADLDSSADSVDSVKTSAIGPAKIILISDMQSGSQVEQLQSFAWPESVQVEIRRVVAKDTTNAVALPISDETKNESDNDRTDDRLRVRVVNAVDSDSSSFAIHWATKDAVVDESSRLPIQVPAGQARFVRIGRPASAVESLVITGDDHEFDNIRYFATDPPATQTLAYIGPETAEARDSLLHYLQRVPLDSQTRHVDVKKVAIADVNSSLDPKSTPLIVVADPVDADASKRLSEFIGRGGRVLIALDREAASTMMASTVSEIVGAPIQVAEAKVGDYHMLSRIDFASPMFAAMSDPQFNDFTKIRFWSHRSVKGLEEPWNIVARFDDGDAAIAQRRIGDGELILLSFGWQPSASQLALSTKFIPLVFSWFGVTNHGIVGNDLTIGDSIPFIPSESASIIDPEGDRASYQSEKDLDSIDSPGIYIFENGAEQKRFAINLPESESRTDPIGDEVLESYGVLLGKKVSMEQAKATDRQLRDRELEGRQKLWRWMLVIALGILGIETWWSGRLSRTPLPV